MQRAPETLVTARLSGARVAESDRPLYRAWWQDPEVARTLGGPRPLAELDARFDRLRAHWQEHGFGVYTVRAGAVACVLYGLAPAAWGRGLATEAARALVEVAFTALAAPEVCAFTWTENTASQRVIARAGMVYRFDFPRAGLPYYDYSLTRDAWSQRSRRSSDSSE
jgi:ribosomal-protein-alanine N-acetyltransferase